MINFDFWNNDTLDTIDAASVTFYPNAGEYRGNVYKNGRAVGDFTSSDSSEIERYFPGIFGE